MSITQRIHDDTDFAVNNAGVTEENQFIYTHGGRVKPGLEYHIHYTNDKKEVYMLDGKHSNESVIIVKIRGGQSLFSRYTNLASPVSKQKYPKQATPIPSDDDYRIGFFMRYFTKYKIDINSSVFEITQDNYNNQNDLYRYFSIRWVITGTRVEVQDMNSRTLYDMGTRLPNLPNLLFPLQYWRPLANSRSSMRKKINLLKNT